MGFSFNELEQKFSNEYISVRSATEFSGYNQQYLRRLLRKGVFRTKKIGQIWLINQRDFIKYLNRAKISTDNRFGPK